MFRVTTSGGLGGVAGEVRHGVLLHRGVLGHLVDGSVCHWVLLGGDHNRWCHGRLVVVVVVLVRIAVTMLKRGDEDGGRWALELVGEAAEALIVPSLSVRVGVRVEAVGLAMALGRSWSGHRCPRRAIRIEATRVEFSVEDQVTGTMELARQAIVALVVNVLVLLVGHERAIGLAVALLDVD